MKKQLAPVKNTPIPHSKSLLSMVMSVDQQVGTSALRSIGSTGGTKRLSLSPQPSSTEGEEEGQRSEDNNI